MAWPGLERITISQLLAGECNADNMDLDNDEEHVVRLHAQTEDDRVINGIGISDDEDCQVIRTNRVIEEHDCEVSEATRGKQVESDPDTQVSKKAKKSKGFRPMVASEQVDFLVCSYNRHFEKYSRGRSNVVQFVPKSCGLLCTKIIFSNFRIALSLKTP